MGSTKLIGQLHIFWNRRHKYFVCLPEISFLLSVQFFFRKMSSERTREDIFYKHENLSSPMGFLFWFWFTCFSHNLILRICSRRCRRQLNLNLRYKHIFPYIDKPLKHIFHLPLTKGTFPDKLNITKITPVFNAGEKTSVSNYRPISVYWLVGLSDAMYRILQLFKSTSPSPKISSNDAIVASDLWDLTSLMVAILRTPPLS